MGFWRRTSSFMRDAALANIVLMTLGVGLTCYQLFGLFTSQA
jgi:hypothetical protein